MLLRNHITEAQENCAWNLVYYIIRKQYWPISENGKLVPALTDKEGNKFSCTNSRFYVVWQSHMYYCGCYRDYNKM